MTSSRMSQTSGTIDSTIFLAALMFCTSLRADEAAHDERLEELEGHHLGQAALVHLEVRAGHDDRAARSSRRACRAGSGGSAPACP